MSRLRGTLTWLVVLLAIARPSDGSGWIADAWVTTKSKIALMTTEELTTSEIAVDTVNGRVSLYGKVPSAAVKQKAEEVVKQVDGVRQVRNQLQIVSPKHAKAVKESDADIQRGAEKALQKDRALAGSGIRVGSVSAGVVVLTGTAKSSVELLRALDRVREVDGVRRVQSNVQIAAENPELDIWSRHELRQEGRGVLDAASDLWLTTQTRLRLLADPRLPALDINVDCRDQKVTLFGIVPSKKAKHQAKEDAEDVPGVKRVHNELQVVAESLQPIVQAHDTELEQAVIVAIYERPEMKHAGIRATVRNGIVRLSGTAPSQHHRLFAAIAARGVPGVRAVEDNVGISTVIEEPESMPPRTPGT